MKKYVLFALITLTSFMAYSQNKVILTVGSETMTATLVDNQATSELKDLLEKGSLTIQMSDYGGFEKVGALPQSFTTSNSQITTEPGDIMLYQGNQLVIFYGTNSWSYTRLGKIDGATVSSLKQFLENGDISLTLSLDPVTRIEEVYAGSNAEDKIYDLNGRRMTNKTFSPGTYIINGKKTLIR